VLGRKGAYVFGQHETAQTSIASGEARTGPSFGGLARVDPFGTREAVLSGPLTNTSQIAFICGRIGESSLEEKEMATLSGTLAPAPSGAHGFDCTAVLTAASAKAMRQKGFDFCVRYLSRLAPQAGGDLSNAEAKAIIGSGLALMAVQHVSRQNWLPNAALGKQFGQGAVANAQAVGLPDGMILWLDLEGIMDGVAETDVIEYCNVWFAEVEAANYQTGIYVGASCILSGDELFFRLTTRHYWRSGSHVPDIPHRGYQMVQFISAKPDVVNGIAIDRDVTMTDALGGNVNWLA
jgi:hypothetical protein